VTVASSRTPEDKDPTPEGKDRVPRDDGLAGTGSAWLLVARREIMVKLTDRAFLVGTIVTVTLMAATIALQAFLGGRTHSYTVVAEPRASTMARAVQRNAPGVDNAVRVTIRDVPDATAARTSLLDGTADAWLQAADGGWVLTTRSQPEDTLQAVVAEVVRGEALRANATALGTTAEALQRGATLQAAFLQGDADRATLITIVTFAFGLLFYLATLVLGLTLANSVVEEKQSRLVEIIATAIPVRQLLAGKILGNTVLALMQVVLYLAVGLVGLAFTEFSSLIPALSGPVLWFVVFFLAGFVALACLWAVAGALASRTEDVQSTSTPLTLLTVAVFFGGFVLEGMWRTVGSFVPPLSAVLMPIRLLRGDAAWGEGLLALGLLLVAAALTVVVGERLYRRSLLQTGGRLGWRQAWRTDE
jgi:ABC-2 type transport system permease protein